MTVKIFPAIGTPERPQPEATEGYPSDMVSLRSLRSALKRRWRLWVTTALLGMVIGAAFHLVVPRKYAAQASLYLIEPVGSDPPEAMATDVSLLQTRAVAERAMASLHLTASADAFLSSYIGASVSDSIMSLKFTATSPNDAVSRANAVARAFLSFRSNQFRSQNKIVVDGLQQQVATLEGSINGLTTSINALSGPSSGSTQLSNLINQRAIDTTELSQLQGQIQQDNLNTVTVTRGSRLLDPAALVVVSAKRVVASDALSGLVAGLGVGLMVIVLQTALTDRVRRRDEVAAILGTPVDLSLGPYRRPWFYAREMARRLDQPSAVLQMTVRRLRAYVEAAPRHALAIIAIEAAEPAAMAAAVLRRSLASEGKRVAMADFADGHPLADLVDLEPRDGEGAGGVRQDYAGLTVGDEDPYTTRLAIPEDADSVLVLATIDPALGADHLAGWATQAVVMVTAGRASAVKLESTGQLLAQAGISLRAAILIGADPDDDTVGLVSDGRLASLPENGLTELIRAGQW